MLGSNGQTKRLIAATALVVAWTLVGPRAAGAEPPSDIAAVDIYREAIPTSVGNVVPDPEREQLAQLPSDVERRLRDAGKDGERLIRVARSSLYGAPAVDESTRAGLHGGRRNESASDAAGPSVAASAMRTPRGIALAGLLALVTATAVAVRARRARVAVLDEAHESRNIVS